MKAIFKGANLILMPETDAEVLAAAAWKGWTTGHVLHVAANAGTGLTLRDLGRREDACRDPINVSSRHPDPAVRLLSNFAETPFELDGLGYRSVEAFWQGLKFEDAASRRRLARLAGGVARAAGRGASYAATFNYGGRAVAVGGPDHWSLMQRACRAKFSQHGAARAALLATLDRPLTHRMRRDSRTIPGAIMAEIWMETRRMLREETAPGGSEDEGAE